MSLSISPSASIPERPRSLEFSLSYRTAVASPVVEHLFDIDIVAPSPPPSSRPGRPAPGTAPLRYYAHDVEMLPTVFATGWASGVNAYLTVVVLGLLGRFGHVDGIPPGLERTDVLVIAGVMFGVELVVDKIPYVDTGWDVISTAIRPTVGAVLGLLMASGTNPADQLVLAAVGGLVALVSHLVKADLRLGINTSPEPASNIAASVGRGPRRRGRDGAGRPPAVARVLPDRRTPRGRDRSRDRHLRYEQKGISPLARSPTSHVRSPVSADVCVVGGGISGIAVALRAAKLGHRVVLIEAADAVGGSLRPVLVGDSHARRRPGGHAAPGRAPRHVPQDRPATRARTGPGDGRRIPSLLGRRPHHAARARTPAPGSRCPASGGRRHVRGGIRPGLDRGARRLRSAMGRSTRHRRERPGAGAAVHRRPASAQARDSPAGSRPTSACFARRRRRRARCRGRVPTRARRTRACPGAGGVVGAPVPRAEPGPVASRRRRPGSARRALPTARASWRRGRHDVPGTGPGRRRRAGSPASGRPRAPSGPTSSSRRSARRSSPG